MFEYRGEVWYSGGFQNQINGPVKKNNSPLNPKKRRQNHFNAFLLPAGRRAGKKFIHLFLNWNGRIEGQDGRI